MKRILIGFLIINLLLVSPLGLIAQEVTEPLPTEEPTMATIVEPAPEPPVAEPPTTEEPMVDPPITEEPVVEPVPTEDPVTEPSTTEPVTELLEEPIVEPPTEEPTPDPTPEPEPELPPEEPIVEPPPENPIVEPPTTEEPIADPPITEEPTPEPDPVPTTEPTPIPPSDHLIINEVMIGSEVNPEKELWIELYNPTDQPINLTGWQIRGVTKGGRWVDTVNDPELSVQPNGYFLLSRYSNSSYSALEFKPEMTKDSLFFPETQIHIELKNPNNDIVDQATFEHIPTTEFRAYERSCLMLDGTLAENWLPATVQINLKPKLLITYGTPHSPNSLCEQAEDIAEPQPEPPPEETTDEPAEEPTEDPVDTPTEDPVDEPATGETLPESQPDPGPEEPPTDTEPEPSQPPPSTSGGSTQSIAPTPTSYPAHQLINEFMPNPEGADTENEWIELYNATGTPIDLGGWYVDDAEGSSSPHQIPAGTVLAPNAYLILREPGLGLSLKNSDDQVRLLDPNKEPKEIISYFGAAEALSFAKKPSGEFEWTPLPTPNTANQFPAPPKSYRPDDVVFFSVLPNPDGKDDGKEKITIKNNLSEPIDLSSWTFMNQKSKEYPLGNITLSPYESFTFNPKNLGLSLVNKSDQLSLLDPAGNLIDRINWAEAPSGKLIFKPNFFHDGLVAKVTRVIDGDTFTSVIDGDEFTIRLIGVDTPETVHPNKPVEAFGIEASNFSKEFLNNQNVRLVFDENKLDTYNRLLAYVYVDGKLLNAELIRQGLGYVYTRFPFSQLETFVELENQAKAERLGIWENEEVIASPEEDDENTEPADEEIETEEIVQNDSYANSETEPKVICPSEGLIIDAILPNIKKGVTTEFIRLTNTTDQKICLNGWQLDDNIVKGSKPFAIRGGSIAPGGLRTFRKSETNISLNNSNDCASLINPLGKVVDQICYNKTHKNEIFTHNGGDYIAPPKKSKARTSGKSTVRTAKQPTRDSIDYKWEMKNETLEGSIEFIYEEGEVLYLKNEQKIIPISYANSSVDIRMTKQLIDFNEPVVIDVRSTPVSRDLIAIRQVKTEPITIKKSRVPTELKYLLGLLILLGGFYVIKKKYEKRRLKS